MNYQRKRLHNPMNLWDSIKGLFRPTPPTKKQDKSIWTPFYGANIGGSYDYFGGQKEPNKAELAKAYEDIVYACVSLISQNIQHAPIRLYVRTDVGQSRPKCATRPVHELNQGRIRRKYLNSNIQEVTAHPLLALMNEPNPFNRCELLEMTQTYLDLTGNGFWLLSFNEVGVPDGIYPLPSHMMQPERNAEYFITSWLLLQGGEQKRYSPEEIVHFKSGIDVLDPYGEGRSPLRGAWGRRQISAKELSYLDNYLSNQGRPDAVLSIKDSINPIESERLAKEFRFRTQGQGGGGLLVLDGTMNLQPLNFPARDLAELQLYSTLKTSICNCYHIPPDLFELGTSSNRSTREAALYAFAAQCLQPRVETLVQKLNDRLCPYFDERFFFDCDSLIPADKEHDLQVQQLLLTQQVVTRDEIRVRHGYTSEDWAREPLLPSGVMPADAFTGGADTVPFPGQEMVPAPAEGDDEPATPEQAPAAAANDLRATVGGSVAVADLQRSYYRRELPREACISNAVLIFGFKEEEAARLFPELVPDAPQQPANAGPETGLPGVPMPPGDTPPGKANVSQRCGGEGGKPGPCPEGGADKPTGGGKPSGGGASPATGGGGNAAHQQAARSWADRAKELPARAVKAAGAKVKEKYGQLEAKYGRKWAIAIIGAGIAGIPLPVPGSMFLTAAPVIAAAKLYQAYTGGKADDGTGELTDEQIEELGRAFMEELLAEWEAELDDGQGDDEQDKTITLPDYRQSEGYDCGAAVTHAVASYFGVGEKDTGAVSEALGTGEEGTRPDAIKQYLDAFGLSAEANDGMSLEDLATATDGGCPVIVAVTQNGVGHYLAVTDVSDDSVSVHDPASGPAVLPLKDFVDAWHDTGIDGTPYEHFGIRVCGGTGSVPKAYRAKALRQKSAVPLVKALSKFFAKLGKEVLSKAGRKAIKIQDFFNVEDWIKSMFEDMRPVLEAYYTHAGNEVFATLNLTPSMFRTVQPKLREGVEQACLVFCEETLKTTALDLESMQSKLRDEITEGLVEGDVKNHMMERVKQVFTDASTHRAFTIGVTEASRAQHNAMMITARESGVVTGKTWLLSADACPLCLPLSGKTVGLDEVFTKDGTGPYANITAPPRHPNCRCTLLLETGDA